MSFAARRVLSLATWLFSLALTNFRRAPERSETSDQGDVDNAAGADSLVCCGAKGGESGCEGLLMNVTPPQARAFDEKVESLIVDSHHGANRIQDPHWRKG